MKSRKRLTNGVGHLTFHLNEKTDRVVQREKDTVTLDEKT
jgi:hypothetical protein